MHACPCAVRSSKHAHLLRVLWVLPLHQHLQDAPLEALCPLRRHLRHNLVQPAVWKGGGGGWSWHWHPHWCAMLCYSTTDARQRSSTSCGRHMRCSEALPNSHAWLHHQAMPLCHSAMDDQAAVPHRQLHAERSGDGWVDGCTQRDQATSTSPVEPIRLDEVGHLVVPLGRGRVGARAVGGRVDAVKAHGTHQGLRGKVLLLSLACGWLAVGWRSACACSEEGRGVGKG